MHTIDPILTLPNPDTKPDFYTGVPTKRLFAWVMDVIVVLIFALIVAVLTVGIGFFVFPFVFMVVGFLYRWITISGGSATWGMRMMAIELRESDGGRMSSGMALLHTLGYYISVGTAFLQPISILFMLLTSRKQGLSDMILGTAMINRPAQN